MRFYDNSNVDFIEFLFDDQILGGTPVMTSGTTPRSMDIQLFDPLAQDKSVFLLGAMTLENSVIKDTQQQREFGNTSEEDFTDSAISFVQAGDRLLHGNGVIRGFDYVEQVADQTSLVFNGGTALVDGSFSTVNRETITIPFAAREGAALPEEVVWAVCVQKDNRLALVFLTDAEENVRLVVPPAPAGATVAASTFNDLVDHRVDLTPVALVTATVDLAGVLITQVVDVRKYVLKETQNIELTVAQEGGTPPSNFRTLNQLTNYLRNYTSSHRSVVLSGNFEVAEDLDWSDLGNVAVSGLGALGEVPTTGVPLPAGPHTVIRFAPGKTWFVRGALDSLVSFRGLTVVVQDGGLLNGTFGSGSLAFDSCHLAFVRCDIGFRIASRTSFEDCQFSYEVETAPVSLGTVHAEAGAIFASSLIRITDITILRCLFETTSPSRYPYVSLRGDGSFVLRGDLTRIRIEACHFDSDGSTDIAAAVALVGTAPASPSPILSEIFILGNDASAGEQGIYVTSDMAGTADYAYGANIHIDGNVCAVIGSFLRATTTHAGGTYIANNTTTLMASLDSTGRATTASASSPITTSLYITGNSASWCWFAMHEVQGDPGGSVWVEDNEFAGGDINFLTPYLDPAVPTSLNNAAIAIANTDTVVAFAGGVTIRGNRISAGSFLYRAGIIVFPSSSLICGNIVDGISRNGLSFGAIFPIAITSGVGVPGGRICDNLVLTSGFSGILAGTDSEVTGNRVEGIELDPLPGPSLGIGVSDDSVVADNVIVNTGGVDNLGVGLIGTASRATVTGNRLDRAGFDIGAYIGVLGNDCIVTDNAFDSPYIDAALSTATVLDVGTGSLVTRNLNQTVALRLAYGVGNWAVGKSIETGPGGSQWYFFEPTETNVTLETALLGAGISPGLSVRMQGKSAGAATEYYQAAYVINLTALLGKGVQIISAGYVATSPATAGIDYLGDILFYEVSATGSQVVLEQGADVNITSATLVQLAPGAVVVSDNGTSVRMRMRTNNTTGTFDAITADEFNLVYRW